ncbi:hypothetical protein [Stenotrophomonas maltophilia]|uniref:hypothetical protein n=1 Tax=Stenotrophomonas maltophilia TaxID=40324 RepID=UPI0015DE074C|nr:hypothetical protein [Stenotrophomonas maltophilia]
MAEAFLDPWLIAYHPDKSSGVDYVARLLSIYDWIIEDEACCEVSAAASALLEEDGVFPLSNVESLVGIAAKRDIFKMVTTILDKLPKIEDRGLLPLLLDNAVTQRQGDYFGASHGQHVVDLFAAALISNRILGYPPCVLTDGFPEGVTEFSCELVGADHQDVLQFCGPHFGECRTAADGRRIRLEADLCSLIRIRDLETGLSSAFDRVPGDKRKWSIGEKLEASLRSSGFYSNDSRMRGFLRSATEIVTGVDQRSIHALRTGRGGNTPQVKRSNGALAWRSDIDDEYHLHYWSSVEGVEFSCVVTHNDFDI